MIAGVLLFVLVPFIVAIVLAVFRQLQTLTTFIAAGVAGALGVAALWLPLDRAVQLGERQVALGEPVIVYGRQLIIAGSDRALLAFVFLAAAGLFLIGWRSGTGALFFPVGMATLGFLSAALVTRPLVYSALSLTIGVVLATLLFASSGQTRGAHRYLVLMTLALPAFMIASWLADLYVPNPTDASLPRGIMLALTGGFALLLGVVPFHIWIRPAIEESPPVAAAFVLTVCNSVCWFLLLDVLQEYPWLVTQQDIFRILQLLGLLTTAAGGILAFSSHDFAHVLAYGVMADYGCALLTLGMRTPTGLTALMFATLARPVSLATLALGLTLARDRLQSSRFDKLTGLGWSNPWTAAALVVGGFSVAGIPPLVGFLGRWSEVRLLATAQPLYVVAVLGATLGVAAGALRGMDYLLLPPPASVANAVSTSGTRSVREPRLMIVLVMLSLLAGLALAMFPGVVEPYMRTVVSAYTFFSAP